MEFRITSFHKKILMSFEKLNYTYSPLIEELSIQNSSIEGVGIFTKKTLEKDFFLGISHLVNESGFFHNNLVRTPLGGLINHSDTPNVTMEFDGVNNHYYFITNSEVEYMTELTLDYSTTPCVNKCG